MLTHTSIKQRTSRWHAKVDQLFSTFDLSERTPYTLFLRANASAIVPLENLLFYIDELPSWDLRSSYLLGDLAALTGTRSESLPAPVPLVFSSFGAQLGALYVLEGSKFGASVLNNRVGRGLPRGFLSIGASADRWRGLLNTIDASACERPSAWLDEVVDGARNAFDLFASSARTQVHLLKQAERKPALPQPMIVV